MGTLAAAERYIRRWSVAGTRRRFRSDDVRTHAAFEGALRMAVRRDELELDDAGVIVGRWEADAGIAAIRAIAEDVRRFASREGMATRASDDVVLAVAEAVADVVVDARHAGARRRLVAEAATDGIWLSVRITSEPGAGGRRPAGVLPLVTALADHVERGPRWAGSGDSVLMEFSMTRAGRLTSAASGPRVDAFVEDPRAAGLARARTRRADVRRARRR